MNLFVLFATAGAFGYGGSSAATGSMTLSTQSREDHVDNRILGLDGLGAIVLGGGYPLIVSLSSGSASVAYQPNPMYLNKDKSGRLVVGPFPDHDFDADEQGDMFKLLYADQDVFKVCMDDMSILLGADGQCSDAVDVALRGTPHSIV